MEDKHRCISKEVNINKKNNKNPVNILNSLKIAHWNANSLNNKKKEFDQFIIKAELGNCK